MTAEFEGLEIPGEEGSFAHKGIFKTAKYIHNCLTQKRILEHAFQMAEVSENPVGLTQHIE